jgi:hypothetical protein
MIVDRDERDGFITCGRDRVEFGDCPGYQSEPRRLVVEVVTRTFGDATEDTSDPYFPIPSVAFEYLHTIDGEPPTCAHCGSAANLSLEPRPTYRRLSDRAPDALVRLRAAERAQAQRAQEALDVEERKAVALEQLARQATSAPGEVDQLRTVIARQQSQIDRLLARVDGNGTAETETEPSGASPRPVAPRPRRAKT